MGTAILSALLTEIPVQNANGVANGAANEATEKKPTFSACVKSMGSADRLRKSFGDRVKVYQGKHLYQPVRDAEIIVLGYVYCM